MKTYYFSELTDSNREAATEWITEWKNGKVVPELGPRVNTIVVGHGEGRKWKYWDERLDADTIHEFECGDLSIMPEVVFWFRAIKSSGCADTFFSGKADYTLSELAGCLKEPKSIIEELYSRRLLIPIGKYTRAPYFDAWHVQLLKIALNLISAGVSTETTVEHLRQYSRSAYCIPTEFTIVEKIVSFPWLKNVDSNGQGYFSFDYDDGPEEPQEERRYLWK